jgi:hypothetical protein
VVQAAQGGPTQHQRRLQVLLRVHAKTLKGCLAFGLPLALSHEDETYLIIISRVAFLVCCDWTEFLVLEGRSFSFLSFFFPMGILSLDGADVYCSSQVWSIVCFLFGSRGVDCGAFSGVDS